MRNTWCSSYAACLDDALKAGVDRDSFNCSSCPMKEDAGDMPHDPEELREVCHGCWALLHAIKTRKRKAKR